MSEDVIKGPTGAVGNLFLPFICRQLFREPTDAGSALKGHSSARADSIPPSEVNRQRPLLSLCLEKIFSWSNARVCHR